MGLLCPFWGGPGPASWDLRPGPWSPLRGAGVRQEGCVAPALSTVESPTPSFSFLCRGLRRFRFALKCLLVHGRSVHVSPSLHFPPHCKATDVEPHAHILATASPTSTPSGTQTGKLSPLKPEFPLKLP